jgi:hypothetical protein
VYNGSTTTGIGRTAGHLFEPGRRACQGPRTDGGTGGTATDACTVPVAVRPSSVDVTLRPGQHLRAACLAWCGWSALSCTAAYPSAAHARDGSVPGRSAQGAPGRRANGANLIRVTD